MKIGVVTVARSDYGIYRPLLRALEQDSFFDLKIIATGSHLYEEYGYTLRDIETDGFEVAASVDMRGDTELPSGLVASMGREMIGFSKVYEELDLDLVFILGDRFEMAVAALAATPFNLPIAHIHGGEKTVGAIDDALRHAITKLSHIHFVTTKGHAGRVLQMGEESACVHVVGAPSLDSLGELTLLSSSELESSLGIELKERMLLGTFHPVTREFEDTREHIDAFIGALKGREETIVLTAPGADTKAGVIFNSLRDFVSKERNVHLFDSLGTLRYFSLMKEASVMVGNSSSGIIEAASFALPVVNIGSRQEGRERSNNVIDVSCDEEAIREAIERALEMTEPEFENVYGDGRAVPRIVKILKGVAVNGVKVSKEFNDINLEGLKS